MTHISGGRSGYISSSIETTHEFFLIDEETKKEKSVSLVNWDFQCREGQKVSVIWFVPKREKVEVFIYIFNHNTDNLHKQHINQITIYFCTPKFFTTWAWKIILLFLAVPFTIISLPFLGISLITVYIIYIIFQRRIENKAKKLLEHKEIKILLEQLMAK